MKKLIILISCLLFTTMAGAQSLEQVIQKHLKAINADKLTGFRTLVLKGHMNMQGMELNIQIYEKAPDKFKSVSNINGMEMVQLVNGDRGYMINPMMGSNEAVALTPDQIASVKNGSMLNSNILEEYNAGYMTLEGEEPVSGRPTYKIKISAPEGTRYIFIDKQSHYLTQMRMSVNQMGKKMTVDIRMSDFKDTDGVMMARTIDTFMNGKPAGTAVYESIEFNREIDDSVFEIK